MPIYISYPYVLTHGRADTHLPDLTLCFSTLPCDEGRLPEYSIFEDHEEFKIHSLVLYDHECQLKMCLGHKALRIE